MQKIILRVSHIFVFIVFFLLCSCKYSGKKVKLPVLDYEPMIEQVTDYSTIYVFYDEHTAGYDLNKNNLITSTHWVFHIDSRIGLPAFFKVMQVMQNQKDSPNLHAKPNSRNYVSVANQKTNKLGFVDVTPTRFFLTEDKNSTSVTVFSADRVRYQGEDMSLTNFILEYYNKDYSWIIPSTMTIDMFLNLYQQLTERGVILNRVYISDKL